MSKEVFLSNPTINAIINYPQPSSLNVSEVIYKPEVLQILTSFDPSTPNFNKIPDAIYPENINSLKSLSRFTRHNRHSCSYIKTISGKGRYYKDNNVNKKDYASLQSCYSKVRRLIVNGNLVSIDLCNAHLEIIKNLAFILKIDVGKYEVLNDYCLRRNTILEEVMRVFDCDREVAKNYFIIILFGGSYDTWISSNYLLNKAHLKTDFMIDFETSFDIIKYELNKLDVINGFKILEKQVNKKKNWRIEKTSLAIFLQEIESKILTIMYQYLEKKDCIIRIPLHDGIWFEDCKNITNNGTNLDFLNELNQEIKNKIGLDIPLDYEETKPNDDDLKWFENHKDFYDANYKDKEKKDDKIFIENSNDDEGASKIVINIYKKDIIRCGSRILVKENNCWVFEKEKVNRVLCNMIVNSNIYFLGAKDKAYSYSNAISHQKNCVIAICNSPLIKTDDKFIDNVSFNNKGYLPFLNGIWNMKEKKLYNYDELPNIHFFYVINRNLNEINKEKYDEFMNKVIIPIFPNEIERNYFAHTTSRAIAGHNEDKKWFGISGLRNCGKGVITLLMGYAFEKYFGTFIAKCLVKVKNSNQEPARALGWLIDHIITRALWSNEIDADECSEILNGILIKMIASGGDDVIGRKLFENNITFKPSLTMSLFFNHMPKIEPIDALENYLEFACKSKFVYPEEFDPEIPIYKLRDDNIKIYIREPECIDAFIWWILNAYDDILPIPQSIKSISDAINKSDVKISVDKFILTNFKIGRDKDRLFTKDIKEILENNGFSLSIKDIHRTLAMCQVGIYKNMVRIDKENAGGYTCIIYKPVIENDGEINN
jgi:hypothetical protein